MIEVKNLVKRYGDHTAVDHLSFEIEKGKIYGFLGPNGAGKSTTMNMITGYIASTEGTVVIDGHDILEEPEEAKKCIGYLPEMPPLYFDMTVLEYLKFVADLKKIPKDKKATMIKGLKQKHTVILSSHILSEVSAVCDYVLIISHGKLVASDTPENLGKLAAGSNNLNLLVKGQKDTIRAALEAVEGVKEITVKKSPEEGVYAITVGTEENMDVREKVFYSMVNAGCPILEMQSKKVSLEEIFLELTESEKKDKDASGKKSGKSFFKTAADAEKYLNEKNEDTVLDNGLEEKEFDESGEVSNDVSDNGLSGDKQDSFAASEKEKGEE